MRLGDENIKMTEGFYTGLKVITKSNKTELNNNIEEGKKLYCRYNELLPKIQLYYKSLGLNVIECSGEKNSEEFDDFIKLYNKSNEEYLCNFSMDMDFWLEGKVKYIVATLEKNLSSNDIKNIQDNGFNFKDTVFYQLGRLVTNETLEYSILDKEITKFYGDPNSIAKGNYGVRWSSTIKGIYSQEQCIYDENSIKYIVKLRKID